MRIVNKEVIGNHNTRLSLSIKLVLRVVETIAEITRIKHTSQPMVCKPKDLLIEELVVPTLEIENTTIMMRFLYIKHLRYSNR